MIVTLSNWNAARWPNFTPDELKCKETGELAMDADFLDKLQAIRLAVGKPFKITSGYRAPLHSIERRKPYGPGTHAHGLAVDIAADGQFKYAIAQAAFAHGLTGIGIAETFIHLDAWRGGPRPNVWIY